ncbi:MAG: copper homeostasis protein CutC [Eubacteriales bacterium]|nr:copper homeostasis protein CutC [Eubacteriales bacterium]
MMNKIILECCVDSVESAIAAMNGGADRIELCSALPMGGLSPQISLFKEVKRAVGDRLKIHVLLRPRGGDFLYTAYDYEILTEETRAFRELGADGVVIGILNADGTVDEERCSKLCDIAGDMSKTFHRAFDMTKDYRQAYETICRLGFDTVLTSGQKGSAIEGCEVLRELNELGKSCMIMPGAGINSSNLEELCKRTGAGAYHMSAKKLIESKMAFRQQSVSMGADNKDEFSLFYTDEAEVSRARKILNNFYMHSTR